MSLKVVGAGVGRTGTASLRLALEQLLDGRCHHMREILNDPAQVPGWTDAIDGREVDWQELLSAYVASVDWPAASFWREISAANPDALVLLSVRDDAEAWWRSADDTIFEVTRRPPATPDDAWHEMWSNISRRRFTDRLDDRDAAIAAYERHNADVRASAPPDRLLEWRPAEGWGPICAALGLPVPDQPFPHVNTTADFRAMTGFDAQH